MKRLYITVVHWALRPKIYGGDFIKNTAILVRTTACSDEIGKFRA